MSESSLFKYYKKIVEEGHETPPESAWEEISKELDVDEVWNKVSEELDIQEVWDNVSLILDHDRKKKVVRLTISWSIAASVLVLVGIFLFNDYFIKTETTNLTKVDSSKSNIENIIKGRSEKDDSSLITLSSPKTVNIENNKPRMNNEYEKFLDTDSIKLQVINDTTQEVIIAQESIILSDSLYKSIAELGLINFLKPNSVYTALSVDAIKIPFSNNENFRNSINFTFKDKLSIGISAVYKNTWLLNRETMDALNPNELNSTDLQFYPDLGLNILYQISNRWAFESNGFISSKYGQDYKAYIYGDYSNKSISLKYTSIELLIKYKSNKSKRFSNLYFNTTVGVYLSKLRTAKLDINNNQSIISDQYHNFDYGLIIGQDFEIYPFNKISFAPGIFFKIGIPNIYNDRTEIPSSLRMTRNGSVEFRLSVYYKLFK